MTAAPSIFLMFQDAPEQAPEGPGWYLSVPDPARDNQDWAILPAKVDVTALLAAAEALDASAGTDVKGFVAAQSAQIAADLAARVAQKHALLAEIEEDERLLAALTTSGVPVTAPAYTAEVEQAPVEQYPAEQAPAAHVAVEHHGEQHGEHHGGEAAVVEPDGEQPVHPDLDPTQAPDLSMFDEPVDA